jgi:hypothetical protein
MQIELLATEIERRPIVPKRPPFHAKHAVIKTACGVHIPNGQHQVVKPVYRDGHFLLPYIGGSLR